jgi:CheY-like chemotaxis protein
VKVLVVEDDEDKRRQIGELLRDHFQQIEIKEAKSQQSGLKSILEGAFDLIILDMTMPTFDITAREDGGRPQAYGGRELLRHMKRRSIRAPAVVLTQFDRFGEGADLLTLRELDEELRREHPGNYAGAVHFSVTDEEWKGDLLRVISEIIPEGKDRGRC